jgi:repressor LexA
VAAGIPLEMIEEVIDEEEIPGNMVGEYFGLRIKGDSMEPKISEGDTVIVRKQDDVDDGDIAIVTINGEDATCKRVFKYAETLVLMSNNPKYPPQKIPKELVENLPVRILGKVVELRAKF